MQRLQGGRHLDLAGRIVSVGFAGDDLVPGYSQDMNNVPALRGQAKVLMTATGHRLNPDDGQLLAGILEQ